MAKNQVILTLNSPSADESNMEAFALYLSTSFKKALISVAFNSPKTYFPLHHLYPLPIYTKAYQLLQEQLESIQETHECVMLVFSYNRRSNLQKDRLSDILQACRELRIPYIGFPEDGTVFSSIKKIALPIGFLIEEKEKAPWSNVFSEQCGAEIELIQPKDRGTRAEKNVSFIAKILDSYHKNSVIIKSTKPSAKIEFDAVALTPERSYDILFISGSREYSLDDIFFRPKELQVLWKSDIPVLIINPRDDIYILCGD